MFHLRAYRDVVDAYSDNEQQTDTPSSEDDGYSGKTGLE